MAGAIHFEFDNDKAEQVILWLLDKHGGRMNYTKLLKLIYLADCTHLKEYGRPIVGGDYCAMDKGPVQSQVYDSIKSSRLAATSLSGESTKRSFSIRGFEAVAEDRVNEDVLSESDLEILAATDSEFGSWDWQRLIDESHKFSAWQKHAPTKTGPQSIPIPYEDIITECCDPNMIAVIRDDQEARQALKGEGI